MRACKALPPSRRPTVAYRAQTLYSPDFWPRPFVDDVHLQLTTLVENNSALASEARTLGQAWEGLLAITQEEVEVGSEAGSEVPSVSSIDWSRKMQSRFYFFWMIERRILIIHLQFWGLFLAKIMPHCDPVLSGAEKTSRFSTCGTLKSSPLYYTLYIIKTALFNHLFFYIYKV
jgi:hypothetical protein